MAEMTTLPPPPASPQPSRPSTTDGHDQPTGTRRRVGGPALPRAPRTSLWDTADDPSAALPDIAPQTTIRDSLYDMIPLDRLELDLIGTPEFTRLQGIKQLGFVYRVWPGATHTRFEHSLGVYFLMLRALRTLLAHRDVTRAVDVHALDLRTLLAAALLHDVGHYPFSHAIEELGYPIIPHEQAGRRAIVHGSIAGVLARHGISAARVADLIDPPRDRALPAVDHLLVRLLSGPLDVDKLDYLPRDARACNVPYGGVDLPRLLGAITVIQDERGPRLGVTSKGISPLNSLLHARQEMFDNVYWHHTNRTMMAMLLRATQEAIGDDLLQPEELTGYDDAALLARLAAGDMPEGTRALVGALRQRQPYKVLVDVSTRAGRLFKQLDALFWDQGKRRQVEVALATALGEALGAHVPAYAVLVDVPKPEKWEMEVEVSFSDPPLGMAPLMSWTDATGQRPSDLGIYEQYQRRIRIVGEASLRDRLASQGRATLVAALEHVITTV